MDVSDTQETSVHGRLLRLVSRRGLGAWRRGCAKEKSLAWHVPATHVIHLFRRRDRQLRFARQLDRAFALRTELKYLAAPDTFVCRCEDVRRRDLDSMQSWREAKLHTRCGMGPCQGRICGPATEFLFGWNSEHARPPVFPARVSTIGCPVESIPGCDLTRTCESVPSSTIDYSKRGSSPIRQKDLRNLKAPPPPGEISGPFPIALSPEAQER